MKRKRKIEIREVGTAGTLKAVVSVPGSKSLTQRSLLIAAIAEGRSLLRNALDSEDTAFLVDALRSLGAAVNRRGSDLLVDGTGGLLENPGREIRLGSNGTALRFLTSLVCLGRGFFTLTGEERLCERPVGPLLEALSHMGAGYRCHRLAGCAPFDILASGLSGGRAQFHEVESSQYVSSLMLSAPYAKKDTVIDVRGALFSRPYVDMTVQCMERFGVPVVEEGRNRFLVPGRRLYKGREWLVEADASSASYFFLAAALCGGSVRVPGLHSWSLQGDMGFLDILEGAGCSVTREEHSVEVKGGILKEGEQVIDLGLMPDMAPTVAVLAACRPGRTVIENAPHLRLKECDRLSALSAELGKTGIRVEERPDGLVIEGGIPKGADIETYRDHRIAMSFAVLGLVAPGMRIKNPGCVKKSFPGFWDRLEELHQ